MKISKKLLVIFMSFVMMTSIFTTTVRAENMADLATPISTFEVLKNVTIEAYGTNYYSVDITEKGTLTLTTTRGEGDYPAIDVYNESGECVYSKPNPDDYCYKDIQIIPLEKGTYLISIYGKYGFSYDLTTSFNKSTNPEILLTTALKEGKTLQLGAALTTSTEKITWKSSKPSIVKVSSDGLITGKKKGSAIITATSESGLTTKIKITVTK